MSLSKSATELYISYKSWLSQNPQLASDIETTVKWISYFIAGRFNSSGVLSELVYSLSNLLVLLNDCLINRSRRLSSQDSGEKLKIFLTVIEYIEVFLEISALKLWGEVGKWIVICIVQLIKSISRLLLVFHHREGVVQNPPVPPLQRKKLAEDSEDSSYQSVRANVAFTLRRSGRVVRTVNAAPPVYCRTWKPPHLPPNNNLEEDIENRQPSRNQLVAETIFIVKPLCYLASLALFGQKTWKPWLIALGMDLSSLHLYRTLNSTLGEKERVELSRRTIALLLYLLRSPFYDRYTKERLQKFLMFLSQKVPLAGVVCRPLSQYIPEWQNVLHLSHHSTLFEELVSHMDKFLGKADC